MQTVDKAVELLGLFSEHEPEIGLSEISRRANFDKATSRRLLLALAKHGLVEQNPDNRRYRIGPGVLRLARVRETTMPLTAIVQPVLKRLVDGTGETAHFTLLSGRDLATVAIQESRRSNRVNMTLGESLPLHATASGLAILAFLQDAKPSFLKTLKLESFTEFTLTDRAQMDQVLRDARELGYVSNLGYYEVDVCSIAAPVFDSSGSPIGTVAVAAPQARFTKENQEIIKTQVVAAATEITSRLGGSMPSWRVA
jgi:DNA-binding IclR family transcriptional regulator